MRLLIGPPLRLIYQSGRSPCTLDSAVDYRSRLPFGFSSRVPLPPASFAHASSSPAEILYELVLHPPFSQLAFYASISRAQTTCTHPSRVWSMWCRRLLSGL